jgi:N-acetyl-gamma-glutamylphosphate reductase
MIKEGDILIAKKTSETLDYIPLVKEEICKVIGVGKSNDFCDYRIQKKDGYKFFLHSEKEGSLYIFNWFYTMAEWRDKQINSILDD